MRLLNVETLRLTSFPDASLAPPYAILSHRWQEDEVLFEDLQDDPLEDLVASLQTRLELLERKQASEKVGFSALEPSHRLLLGVWTSTCSMPSLERKTFCRFIGHKIVLTVTSQDMRSAKDGQQA
jgi:hypothetical protein